MPWENGGRQMYSPVSIKTRRPCERRDPYAAADIVVAGWLTASLQQ
jgi:hypothetical protein